MRFQFPSRTLGHSAPRRLRLFVATLTLTAALSTNAFAMDPTASRNAARAGVSDAMLARSALAALDRDPLLRDVSLVVSIVDRQAVIGGAVPTPDLSQRAEAIVRQATGIEVKNRCFVQSRPDPLIRAVADRLNPNVRQPNGHDLPGIVRPPRMQTTDDAALSPSTALASDTTASVTPVVTLKIPSTTSVRPSLLLDPTVAPSGPRYASQPPMPTISPVPTRLTNAVPASVSSAVPVAVPNRATDLMGTLLDLRRTESRFAGLTVEMREGTVFLAGSSPRDLDAWDFAERVRRVPGVRQVVVGNVNRR